MRTCLVITGTYNTYQNWCWHSRFKKFGTDYVKYTWDTYGKCTPIKRAIYVSKIENLQGWDPSKIEIIKAGNFRANPLYRNGYSHLINGLESKIKSVWDRSYMSQIDQEFDKLLEEL